LPTPSADKRGVRGSIALIVFVLLLGAGALLLWSYARRHPEDMPWTRLDLTQPVGAFTGRKLAALADEPPVCRRLLARAGVNFATLPQRTESEDCGIRDGVRPSVGRALAIGWRPRAPAVTCPVAAGLALWEWHVVQPAAIRHLHAKVVAVEHLGSYSCRRIGGTGQWSEHARANALDVAGFRLADGRRISVMEGWNGRVTEAAFLRDVRNGSCRLFATVLSPDYNAAHRDHLHLDQASRGAMGWRMCR
jgi:hypothetical protein